MIIILEGTDGGGKSTLAKELQISFSDSFIFHAGYSRDLQKAMPDYHGSILDNAILNHDLGNLVILDRHWPSDCVYRRILKDLPEEEAQRRERLYRHMFERLEIAGAMYIHCYSDSAFDHHDIHHDNWVYKKEIYRQLVEEYQRLWDEWSFGLVLHHDWTKEDAVSSTKYLINQKLDGQL